MENSELTDEQFQEFRAFCNDFDRTNNLQRAWYFSKGEDLQTFWSDLQHRYTDKAYRHGEAKGEASANNDVVEYWKQRYALEASIGLAKTFGELAALMGKATADKPVEASQSVTEAIGQIADVFREAMQAKPARHEEARVIRDVNGLLVAAVIDGRKFWIATLSDLGNLLDLTRGTESQGSIARRAKNILLVVSDLNEDSLKAKISNAKNRSASIDIASVRNEVLSWFDGGNEK